MVPTVDFGPIIPRKELNSAGSMMLYGYTRNIKSEDAQVRAILEDIQLLADILHNVYGRHDLQKDMKHLQDGIRSYGELEG